MEKKVGKRNRKSITLHTKMKIINFCDKGLSNSEISRILGLPRTRIVTVIKSKQKILNEFKKTIPVKTTVIRKRDNLIADMEKYLIVWIQDQTNRNIHLTQVIIQNKAQNLFNEIKSQKGITKRCSKFRASRGWFSKFKKRYNLNNNKIQSELLTTDNIDVENFPHELAQIIKDGGYTKDQIFNVDETILFWKKMSTSTAKEDELCTDKVTLLLGTNASGRFKLKPMLIYDYNSVKILENYAKTNLPVFWKSNANAWMTASLFEEWYSLYFLPTIEEYCVKSSIPFKILLLLDNAPSHPRTLNNLCPNIKVIFLPPISTSLLQPMNQGIKAAFKFYYVKRIFSKCISKRDCKLGNKEESMETFLEHFTIINGTEIISEAWNDIKISTIQDSWTKICPQLIDDFKNATQPLSENNAVIEEMTIKVKLEDIIDIEESHLSSSENHSENKVKTEDIEDISSHQFNEVNYEELSKAFNHFEAGMSILEKIDPNSERSFNVNTTILNTYACYREIYNMREKNLVN